MTDFNIAVHFTERRALTSVAGSMAYMGTFRSILPDTLDLSIFTSPRSLSETRIPFYCGLVVTRCGSLRASVR